MTEELHIEVLIWATNAGWAYLYEGLWESPHDRSVRTEEELFELFRKESKHDLTISD